MELTQDYSQGQYQIRSYSPGSVTINDKTNDKIYTKSILVSMSAVMLWKPQTFAQLKAKDFQIIADQTPEVVILGTGERQQFPDPSILAPLINKNIGVEVMDTSAACRTFNVVAAEGRNVVAALLL